MTMTCALCWQDPENVKKNIRNDKASRPSFIQLLYEFKLILDAEIVEMSNEYVYSPNWNENLPDKIETYKRMIKKIDLALKNLEDGGKYDF